MANTIREWRQISTSSSKRLGLDKVMDELGGVRHHENAWTKRGWIHERREAAHGYNIRRRTLDPVLRATAASVTGGGVDDGRQGA